MLTTYTENILATVLSATPYEVRQGIEWYELAGSFARQLSKDYNVSLACACSVIAALSPQKSWASNQSLANRFFAARAEGVHAETVNGQTRANSAKAWECMQHTQVRAIRSFLPMLGVKAPKVKAFALNIFDAATGGHAQAVGFYDIETEAEDVTLDRHAIRVCDPANEQGSVTSSEVHLDMRCAYVEATMVVNALGQTDYKPYQLQAIAWVAVRGGAQ